MEANVVRKRAGSFQYGLGAVFRPLTLDDQVHALMPRQVADDLGINPWDRIELARPVAAEMRPSQPRRFVRLPLRGHAVSLCGGEKSCARRSFRSRHFPSSMRLVMGA